MQLLRVLLCSTDSPGSFLILAECLFPDIGHPSSSQCRKYSIGNNLALEWTLDLSLRGSFYAHYRPGVLECRCVTDLKSPGNTGQGAQEKKHGLDSAARCSFFQSPRTYLQTYHKYGPAILTFTSKKPGQ